MGLGGGRWKLENVKRVRRPALSFHELHTLAGHVPWGFIRSEPTVHRQSQHSRRDASIRDSDTEYLPGTQLFIIVSIDGVGVAY